MLLFVTLWYFVIFQSSSIESDDTASDVDVAEKSDAEDEKLVSDAKIQLEIADQEESDVEECSELPSSPPIHGPRLFKEISTREDPVIGKGIDPTLDIPLHLLQIDENSLGIV